MGRPRKDLDEVSERLAAVFRDKGYEGASLAELSEAARIGRSSLYHHFPDGKADMAAAAADHVGRWLSRHALAPLAEDGAPEERLARAADALSRFYDAGRAPCLIDGFALGGTADAPRKAGRALAEAFIDALAAFAEGRGAPADDARRGAEDMLARMEGALIVSRTIGDTAPFARFLESFQRFAL